MMTATAAKSGWMGTFSPVTFSHLLKQVADESRSGAFQIVSGNRIKTVHVDRGAVRFATSNVRDDRLGESMLAHDSISTTDYRAASQKMRDDGCRFGEALLKMGRLDRKKLHRELGVQVQRIVLSLFRLSDGLYSFDENTPTGVQLPFSLSVPPLLLKGLQRVKDGRGILDALPPANAVVRMTREPTYKFDLARLARVVSIFEEHTDIIRKDRRETLYGHKVCMTGGSSSMILDCVILDGNPSDSTLAETMIDRQVELYERAPRQVAYDGAFSSKANLEAIKGKGVEDVAFTKAHFAVTDMVKSSWVYQRLRRFRCGIEGVISFLKRVFGLDRCTWRSLPSFKSYVWSSIITCNLLMMARHLLR